MTTITDSRSQWDYEDLARDTTRKMAAKKLTRDEAKDILDDFLRRLPNGIIVTNGYFQKFIQA